MTNHQKAKYAAISAAAAAIMAVICGMLEIV